VEGLNSGVGSERTERAQEPPPKHGAIGFKFDCKPDTQAPISGDSLSLSQLKPWLTAYAFSEGPNLFSDETAHR
jgi:hypothetical protein